MEQKSPVELRCALIGHPVAHSRSPLIHRLFAEQFSLPLRYDLLDVEGPAFNAAVQQFFATGGLGLNVTVPHKMAAFALADQATARAATAGAVNTLREDQGRLVADNTDGAGLVRDLTANHGIELGASRILILGAGGAVRGCLGPILETGPALVRIANRTAARARQLATDFTRLGTVEGCGFDDLETATSPFDLVIHATSAGLTGQTPKFNRRGVAASTFCYDMFYARGDTAFLRWCRKAGARRLAAGWGMLVEQAAESFEFWHGRRPETGSVIARLLSA
jgi:shikimate dehydrogenase